MPGIKLTYLKSTGHLIPKIISNSLNQLALNMAISFSWFPRERPIQMKAITCIYEPLCSKREGFHSHIVSLSDLLPGTCRFLFWSTDLKNAPKNHSANSEQEPGIPRWGSRNAPMVPPVRQEMSPLLSEQDSGSGQGLCKDSPSSCWLLLLLLLLFSGPGSLSVSFTDDRFLSGV